MEKETENICAGGLTFFGRTNRFISHELKNILAIISETLGLIDELLELAGTGRELKPGKLRSLSRSVIEEVERANEIIKNMNTFGHSVDELFGEVDLRQTISLMIRLLRLDPSSRKTEIHFQESDIYMVYGSPFFLGNLIYQLLNYSVAQAAPESVIKITISPGDSGIRITLAGLAGKNRSALPGGTASLAQALSAGLAFDDRAGTILLDLPASIDQGLLAGLLKENEES